MIVSFRLSLLPPIDPGQSAMEAANPELPKSTVRNKLQEKSALSRQRARKRVA